MALLPGTSRGLRRAHRLGVVTQRKVHVDQPHLIAILAEHLIHRVLGLTAVRALIVGIFDDRHGCVGGTALRMIPRRYAVRRRLTARRRRSAVTITGNLLPIVSRGGPRR